jgi:glutaredoxin 2
MFLAALAASAVKALYERIVLYADNWAEVNLVNQKRREFDTLTQQFAASPWRFDEWLNAQNALLPQSDALATLQALLTETAKLRVDALSQSAPVAALMQNLTAIKLTHQPGFDHQPITHQLIQLDDQARLMHLHHGLLEQSAALARNQAR